MVFTILTIVATLTPISCQEHKRLYKFYKDVNYSGPSIESYTYGSWTMGRESISFFKTLIDVSGYGEPFFTFNDQVSSLKFDNSVIFGMTLYEDRDWKGNKLFISSENKYYVGDSFNDKMSSWWVEWRPREKCVRVFSNFIDDDVGYQNATFKRGPSSEGLFGRTIEWCGAQRIPEPELHGNWNWEDDIEGYMTGYDVKVTFYEHKNFRGRKYTYPELKSGGVSLKNAWSSVVIE